MTGNKKSVFLRSHSYGEHLTIQIKINKHFNQPVPRLRRLFAQLSSPRPLFNTRAPEVRIFCGRQEALAQDFLTTSCFLYQYHTSHAPYSLVLLPPTLYDLSKWQRLYITRLIIRHSQRPRGLRRETAAARLLGLWVRIPPGACMSVRCECCVLSGRGLRVGLITRPEESYRVCCVWVWSRILDNEEGDVAPW